MSESTLTLEKLREAMRLLPSPEPDLFNPFQLPRFMGRQIYEAPPAPPKIQVKSLRLSDGTPLLPYDFLTRENARWLERFGYRDDPFKDNVYLLGGYGIVASPMNAHLLWNIGL